MPTPEQVAALLELVDMSLRDRRGEGLADSAYQRVREHLARRALAASPEAAP